MNRVTFIILLLFMATCVLPVIAQTGNNNIAVTANPPTGTYADGYNLGMMSAGSSTWYGVGSLVTGCCVGGLMPASMGWGVPLVTAAAGSIPMIVAATGNPQPQPVLLMSMEGKGQDYVNGFRTGYSQAKKHKNISSSAVGLGVAVGLAIGAVVLLQAAEETDDEVNWAP